MFLSTESPSHSVRATPYDGGELLIVGGESHKAGTSDPVERYARAGGVGARALRRRGGRVPLVGAGRDAGRRDPLRRQALAGPAPLWTASGFKKWGITNGAAAAIMLADAIDGRAEPVARDVRREPLQAARVRARSCSRRRVSVGAHFFGDRLASPDVRSLDELAPGEGGIVKVDGDKVAAFRDDDGVVHAVSPICTHLYCQVALQRRRALVGLPVPRLALRDRRHGAPGAGGQSAGAEGAVIGPCPRASTGGEQQQSSTSGSSRRR